jgi:hypothetical protein
MEKDKSIYHFILFVFMIMASSCHQTPQYNVAYAIKKAGDNGEEIKKLLHRYNTQKDTFLQKSAGFIISNMVGVSTDSISYTDAQSHAAPFDICLYSNQSRFSAFLKSNHIKVQQYSINDLKLIKADYLAKNIDSAYSLYSNYHHVRQIPFDVYCDYLLPYKLGNERIENWREFFYEKFNSLLKDSSLSTRDIYKAIDKDINQWFTYNKEYVPALNTLSISQALELKSGACMDIANLHIAALRSIGIPAALELVPYWGNNNFGHSECAYWNGQPAGFQLPDSLRFYYGAPKVFRKTFAAQVSEATKITRLGIGKANIPEFFFNDRWIDITPSRTNAGDIVLPATIANEKEIIYLCVYNAAKWQAISWAPANKNGKLTFSDMGRNIVYALATYHKGTYTLLGRPFLYKKDGQIQPYEDAADTEEICVERTGADEWLKIQSGKRYHLYRWNVTAKKWNLIKSSLASMPVLTFTDIPKGSLLRLAREESQGTARFFTYELNRQIWR